jgi:cytochrome c-type biogenesis protein CcmH
MNAVLFWVLAIALVVGATALVIVPLLRGTRELGPREEQLSLEAYRRQIRELEQDRANGLLNDVTYEVAQRELESRLLQDVAIDALEAGEPGADTQPAPPARRVPWAAAAVLIALPALSFGLYQHVGVSPSVLADPERLAEMELRAFVAQLEAQVARDPRDDEAWWTLARGYGRLGQVPNALNAYARALEARGDDATLLTEYAQALAMTQPGQTLVGEPRELLERAVKADPDYPDALWLAGVAASQAGDPGITMQHWQRLLAQVEPGSQRAELLGHGIALMRERLARAGAAEPDAPALVGGLAGEAPAAGGPVIEVNVALAPELADRVQATDPVFVFVTAAGERGPPLAVARREMKDLPAKVVIDDSKLMLGGSGLSAAAELVVGARVARSGEAMRVSGDLETRSSPFAFNGRAEVELTIDEVVP